MMKVEKILEGLRAIEDYYDQEERWHMALYGYDVLDTLMAAIDYIEESLPQNEWISVNDKLPTEEGQECWVWCKEMGEPEVDNWDGGRGEKAFAVMGANNTVEFTRSGWYYNDMQPITHWMPIDAPKVPEPPKEGDGK